MSQNNVVSSGSSVSPDAPGIINSGGSSKPILTGNVTGDIKPLPGAELAGQPTTRDAQIDDRFVALEKRVSDLENGLNKALDENERLSGKLDSFSQGQSDDKHVSTVQYLADKLGPNAQSI